MSSVCLMIVDDGRADYLDRCLESASVYLPPMDACVMVGDPDHEMGFAGAVQAGWEMVLASGAEWVFHCEGDFAFNEPVPLERMINILKRHPHLTQMSLLRQAWNDEEKRAGGIVQAYPDDFHECCEQTTAINGNAISYLTDKWTETSRFLFTTNPSVYSTKLCERGFPDAPAAEGRFGGAIRGENPNAACGIWGGKWDAPRVTHIGVARAGRGY